MRPGFCIISQQKQLSSIAARLGYLSLLVFFSSASFLITLVCFFFFTSLSSSSFSSIFFFLERQNRETEQSRKAAKNDPPFDYISLSYYMASSHLLPLFLDLNDLVSAAGPSAPASTLPNLPMMSIEQIMAAQSDIEANHFTLTSCMETVTTVTKLTHRLQNRTSELHQVNTQLLLLQRMCKDARAKIGALKVKNKELKRKTTSMARFGATSFLAFNSRLGVLTPDESMGVATSSVAQGDKKKKRAVEDAMK